MTNLDHSHSVQTPVSLITGFLGSGKTTLLARLLLQPHMTGTAVIINEFGEIGLDHRLVKAAEGQPVVMSGGCVCCTVRSDLFNTLRDLYLGRMRGNLPEFRRVIIETTGLADPAPIMHTLIEEPVVERSYRLDAVVTTVDAVNGEQQLDAYPESVKQAAIADRIVLTKVDLAATPLVNRLKERLRWLNPVAPIVTAVNGEVDAGQLFNAGPHDVASKSGDVLRWLSPDASHDDGNDHTHINHARWDRNRHDARIHAHCFTLEEPLEWRSFASWLEWLAASHGEKLLRVKGILNFVGEPAPVVVHGVQHLFYPPTRLLSWPDPDRRSQLVVITRDLDRAVIENSLRKSTQAVFSTRLSRN
jgi:G3E family GTPase